MDAENVIANVAVALDTCSKFKRLRKAQRAKLFSELNPLLS